MSADGLKAAEQKMRDAGHSDEAIRAFRSAYKRLEGGDSGMMPTDELEPAADVPSLDELPEGDPAGALEQFAVVKLNGGLATTMGLRSPKSLLEAREGRTFLDIIIGQTLALRRRFGVRLPLEDVPHVQKRIIRLGVSWGRPVITATQMLESMVQSPSPTRAEVSDVANAVLDGTSALMLSAETAVGRDPVAAVATMAFTRKWWAVNSAP
jgi:hypothetical protein